MAFEVPFVSQPAEFALPAELSRGNESVDGQVVFVALIDAEGNLIENILLGSTHQLLEPIAATALANSAFSPGRMLRRPIEAHVAISFLFNTEEPRIECFDVENLTTRRVRGRRLQSNVYGVDELDQPPALLHNVAPVSDGEGSVKLEYFIGTDGSVRMPTVVEPDFNGLGPAVQSALSQWKFAPPRRNGEPVIALVRQTFHFGGK